MEDYYYLIPVLSEHTYINNYRLIDLYNDTFPFLLEKNNKKDSSIREHFKSIINKFNDFSYIPEYILVIQNGNRCYEIITNFDVTTDDYYDFKKYEITDKKRIIDYFVQSDYKNKIFKLFKNYGLFKEKKLLKKISNY